MRLMACLVLYYVACVCHVDGALIGVIALNLLWFCGFGLLLVGWFV